MRNIVLIGMPGCGKSTIGAALARRLGRPFFDADQEVCKMTGKTIPEIFREEGENAFRKIESSILAELGKRSGIILATGGGCVTIPENKPHLLQNGTVIWLQRKLEDLPAEGRPLSMTSSVYEIYEKRAPLYDQFSDIVISNDCCVDDTVRSIIHYLEEME